MRNVLSLTNNLKNKLRGSRQKNQIPGGRGAPEINFYPIEGGKFHEQSGLQGFGMYHRGTLEIIFRRGGARKLNSRGALRKLNSGGERGAKFFLPTSPPLIF